MLRGDSEGVRRGRLCLVADPCRRLNGNLAHRARTWLSGGWEVHVLHAAEAPEALPADVRRWSLDDFSLPAELLVPTPYDTAWLTHSGRVRHALEQLHARYGFSVIEIPPRGASGFRVLQARRAGLGFQGVRFTIAPGASEDSHAERSWPASADDLQLDFCERQCLAWADEAGPSPPPSLPAGQRESDAEQPLVSVVVPFFNLGDFLPAALESLAAQTHANVEVLVIDDGSTEAESLQVFEQMRQRYPYFRFVRQENAGIGATRNRGLLEARGRYFLPFDADNIARPEMLERFLGAARGCPGAAAWTCAFLAFTGTDALAAGRFAYAYRPTAGCRVLAALRNVFGDGAALFDAEILRQAGGFETDRDASWEDWEVFIKLVNSGRRVEVVPETLFYYRHRPEGFSLVKEPYRNQQRVLRQFFHVETLAPAERRTAWSALAGFHLELERLRAENRALEARLASRRHRLADRVHALCRRLPRTLKALLS